VTSYFFADRSTGASEDVAAFDGQIGLREDIALKNHTGRAGGDLQSIWSAVEGDKGVPDGTERYSPA